MTAVILQRNVASTEMPAARRRRDQTTRPVRRGLAARAVAAGGAAVARRVLLLAAGLVVVGLLSSGDPARAAVPVAKPTIVLVNGAWDRAASWTDVAARLRGQGYPVVVPENPLRSLSGDAAAIAGVLHSSPGPIVLVGHSYGGAVITDAAVGITKVRALVYIAAFAPDLGESIFALDAHDLGSLVPAAIVPVPFIGPTGPGIDTYINPLLYPTVMAADVPPATAAAMASEQHPLTVTALTDGSGPPAWRSIPSWYLVARSDQAIPAASERFMAARIGAHTVEIDSSHAAHVAHPGPVGDLIAAAAAATAG